MNKPKAPLVIEISKSAIEHNIKFVRQLIGPEVTYASVVKGNAYGHGIEVYCPIALQAGVDMFCTYTAEEAYRVWKSIGGEARILIMGYISPEELDWVIECNIEFFVFDNNRLNQAILAAKRLAKKALVHLELETGMNRTGFSRKLLPSLLEKIDENEEWLNFKGICTHFAGAESITNYHRIKKQHSRFKKVVKQLKEKNQLPECVHSACSAAVIAYPKSRYNLVRIGILQYGFFPSKEIYVNYISKSEDMANAPEPKNILTWKSTIMDIKEVPSGEFIGYGTSYFTNTETRIAIVPVGYALGYNRNLSNLGKVLIQGKRHSIIGTINMNALSVNITGSEGIEIGDEVVLIGTQGAAEITVSSFYDQGNLPNYELLTRLPSEIPRILVD